MRILLVDDNPMIGRSFARVFKGAGHEAQLAQSVAEAADKLHDEKFDAVLTDYDLGSGGTGKAVCELARAHKLPVVMVTATDSVTPELVGAPVLYKPAPTEKILEELRKAGAPC